MQQLLHDCLMKDGLDNIKTVSQNYWFGLLADYIGQDLVLLPPFFTDLSTILSKKKLNGTGTPMKAGEEIFLVDLTSMREA